MTITLTVNLPPEIEQRLQAESGDLSSAVRESFAINLFRRGILTHHELGQVLGLDRFETDALLKRNDVTEYSLTHEDLDADVSSLKEFLGLEHPMIVVADASPFVVLVAIGHVDVLPTLFREVLIPIEVASELASSRRPPEVSAFIATPPPWLRILAPSSIETIPGPDAGQTAAIALAAEVQAGRLIIDEYRGRKAATERGLRVAGTVGVLELAAEMGLIDLKRAFERVKQTDFWISHKLLDERLALFLPRKQAP